MDKGKEIVDEKLRIQNFLEAAKRILKEIKPVDSSNVVLFNGPPGKSKNKKGSIEK